MCGSCCSWKRQPRERSDQRCKVEAEGREPMKEIERALRERIGLDAASIGSSLLQRTIRLRMKRNGLKRTEDYRSLLQSSNAEWNELVESVVITETWFFRDNGPFIALLGLLQEWLSANPVGRV